MAQRNAIKDRTCNTCSQTLTTNAEGIKAHGTACQKLLLATPAVVTPAS